MAMGRANNYLISALSMRIWLCRRSRRRCLLANEASAIRILITTTDDEDSKRTFWPALRQRILPPPPHHCRHWSCLQHDDAESRAMVLPDHAIARHPSRTLLWLPVCA